MKNKTPKVNVSILVIRDNKILLGLLTPKWNIKGKRIYGIPGRDIYFREKIGDAVRRNIKEEIDCDVVEYKVICVNANYEFGNHYISIGVFTEINDNPKLLLPKDWEKWEWFSYNQIPKDLFPDAENTIKCYLEKKVYISE